VSTIAKISGLGWTTFSVDDSAGAAQDIRNDITNFQLATPRGVQETTGLDKSAMERILLLADLSVTVNTVFNAAANREHVVFRTISSSSALRTTSLAIASQTLASELLYTDRQLTRAADGSFTASMPGVLADGTVPTWA
jgi:hypothetical protein